VKRGAAVEVIWEDAHGGDEGWVRLTRAHSRPARIRSVGILHKRSEEGITLIMSLDRKAKLVGGYLFVLEVNIISARELVCTPSPTEPPGSVVLSSNAPVERPRPETGPNPL
jgi:hypothetical protein